MLELFAAFQEWIGGNRGIALGIAIFAIGGLVLGFGRGFLRARKIQPNGFKWKTLRTEIIVVAISVPISSFLISYLTKILTEGGFITTDPTPVAWYVVLFEYALFFFAFDTWFYWWHRAMHIEPLYKWIHKIHHWSTSPNIMSTAQVTPLESLINGGVVPLILAAYTMHDQTMLFIGPTTGIMGLYVHSGYEFLPRWWNKTWLTKWFITTTFHDQHHKYFVYNFGGFSTVWDYICGTVRPKYEEDFSNPKGRRLAEQQPDAQPAPAAAE